MKKNLLYLIMSAAVIFAACKDDKDKKDPVTPPTVTDENLSGAINSSRTLDAAINYTLTGPLIVEDGGVLTIPAGTTIKARKGFGSYILVLQGGKINVNGTAEKPVTMTADIANAEQGHWGGLIINGKAPLADPSEVGSTEINSAYVYGGNDPNDNSGTITYLKLEYTGARSSANVEHNGLTLNGVGAGTTIENIYIPNGADDGIEFFGGCVNVKNLLVVNSDDDMFDFTQGYCGTLENAYGIWEAGYVSSESDPRSVEADGNLDGLNPEYPNQANFTIKNMTVDLRLEPNTTEGFYMHDVIKVRRGAIANIENALVKGQGQVKDLIDLKDKKGDGQESSVISLTNSLTTPFSGKDINKEEGTTYENVKIEDGNTGCPTNLFGWTGYQL